MTHSKSILHVQRYLSEHTRTHTHWHAHTEETADQGKRRRQGLRTGRKWTTGIPQATSMQNLFSHPAPGRNKRATGIPQTTGTPPHSGAKRDHWNARSHTYTHPHRSGSTGHCNLANVFVRVCLHAHMLTCVYAYMYMSGTLPIRLSNRIVL